MKIIKPIKITKKNFAKFGELINTKKGNPININNGYAKRFHDLININTDKKREKQQLVFLKQKRENFQ